MGRNRLTPQEIELKKIISSNLTHLLETSTKRKIDIHRELNIPTSTVSDYFSGKTLPSDENIEKLARLFKVNTYDIDPRMRATTMVKNSPQYEANKRFFSIKLNELLKLHNKKQIDLHRDLHIPKSTITGYVKGTSMPTMGNIQKIADYFNVMKSDIDLRFKDANNSTDDGLRMSLLNKFDKLHTDNKKKVVDYADNRLKDQLRQNNKVHSINATKHTYIVDVLGSVSAGTGEWLSDEQHNEVIVNNEPPIHDFALKVTGDSMTPMFSDGQIIYVNHIDDLSLVRNNQIVIAELNGNSYVKKIEFDNNRQSCKLISLNIYVTLI